MIIEERFPKSILVLKIKAFGFLVILLKPI